MLGDTSRSPEPLDERRRRSDGRRRLDEIRLDGQVTESTQVWTLDGSTLTVETTNARGTQKRIYKK